MYQDYLKTEDGTSSRRECLTLTLIEKTKMHKINNFVDLNI